MPCSRSRLPVVRVVLALVLGAQLGTLSLSVSGCTAIGYSIGSAMDRGGRRKPGRVVPAGRALRVGVGTPLRLHLRDDSSHEGVLLGRGFEDDTSYAARYGAWQAGRADSFPALGDPVTAIRRDGHHGAGTFHGFAYRCVVWKPEGSRHLERLRFDAIQSLRMVDGGMLASEALARADVDRVLPSRELILLLPGSVEDYLRGRRNPASITSPPRVARGDTLAIGFDQVAAVDLLANPHMRRNLALVGFAADMSIIVAATMALSGPFDGGSCDSGMNFGGYSVRPTEHPFDVVAGRFATLPEPPEDVPAAVEHDAGGASGASGQAAAPLRP